MSNEAKASVQREAPPDETADGLAAQVAAVEGQIEKLAAAMVSARRTRLGIFLAFLILVCIVSYSFYKLAEEFRSEENINQMGQLAQQHLDDNSTRYMNEVKFLVDESKPVLVTAFKERAKEDSAKYQAALDEQRAQLLTNLTTRLEENLTAHYQEVLKRHERILKEEFPDVTEEQMARVGANLEEAATRLVKKYYVDRMSDELQAMYQTWDRFPVADSPGPLDPKLEDQLVGCMLEIMTMKLASTEAGGLPLGTN